MPGFDERVAELAAQMHSAAVARGAAVTGDGRVAPEIAADLLGVSAETLRRWRAEGNGPCLFTVGGRITYALADLAGWLLRQRMTAAEFAERQATNASSSVQRRLASGRRRGQD